METTVLTANNSVAHLRAGKNACPPKWRAFFDDGMSQS